MSKLLGKLLTRSFPGKPSEAFPVLNPSADAGEASAPDQRRGYESRAFSLWLDELTRQQGNRLIDFGPMYPESVSFFCQYQMGLSILGLDAEADLNLQLEQFRGEDSYHAALAWEFPNYLNLVGLKRMGQWLTEHIEPGGVVMLSLAIKSPYSDHPASYRIVEKTRLERIAGDFGAGRHRRYTSGELSKHWPAFEPVRSFLLRTGMQEYVLRRRRT